MADFKNHLPLLEAVALTLSSAVTWFSLVVPVCHLQSQNRSAK
jgi:hypothetical protein